jgi:hypothetical protein
MLRWQRFWISSKTVGGHQGVTRFLKSRFRFGSFRPNKKLHKGYLEVTSRSDPEAVGFDGTTWTGRTQSNPVWKAFSTPGTYAFRMIARDKSNNRSITNVAPSFFVADPETSFFPPVWRKLRIRQLGKDCGVLPVAQARPEKR